MIFFDIFVQLWYFKIMFLNGAKVSSKEIIQEDVNFSSKDRGGFPDLLQACVREGY